MVRKQLLHENENKWRNLAQVCAIFVIRVRCHLAILLKGAEGHVIGCSVHRSYGCTVRTVWMGTGLPCRLSHGCVKQAFYLCHSLLFFF